MLRTLGLSTLLATALVTSACAPPSTMPCPGGGCSSDDHGAEVAVGVGVGVGIALVALIAVGIQVAELALYMHARAHAG